jgi:UTP:GlnB (protein PII) uridylyltransferase
VAGDRPGLLAAVAQALAAHSLSICAVRATAWAEPQLALLSVSVRAEEAAEAVPWDTVGEALRGAMQGTGSGTLQFRPVPPVHVTASPQEAGRSLVTVDAPEQLELLWAAARWFEEAGANIEAASIDSARGRFRGTFLVAGAALDATGLAGVLAGTPARPSPGRVARLVARLGVAVGGLGAAVVWRVVRAARRR